MGDLGGGLAIREKAISLVRDAVEKDKAADYPSAFKLYMSALDHFTIYLKYEKNPMMQQTIKAKFTEYLERAEELKRLIDGEAATTKANPGHSPDGALRAKPGKTGGGKPDADDEEIRKMQSSLGGAIVTEKPNVSWSDVAGLDAAKDALKEAVILPVKFPQFFTGKRKAWSGFLLYGPPGTGKSFLAKAVATEAASTFFSISSSDLVSKWMGESEKLVSQLFSMAREQSPSIIFIDEIDALCGARGEGGESEASRRIKTEILVQMQGVGSNDGNRVLVLAATNTPYQLDQAVRRRFDKRIYIPLPDASARAHMFKVHVGETPNDLTEAEYQSLGAQTEGFSGSDIDHVVKDVLYEPVRKVQEATHFKTVPATGFEIRENRLGDSGTVRGETTDTAREHYVPCSPGDPAAWASSLDQLADLGYAHLVMPPNITANDFRKVLLKARPTVAKADLEIHERFTREFGEEG
jgi:vacuolar protein-sorting-associated protein 4